jgi:hypothetical protein
MTRDELLAQLATRRARKISLTWAQFAGAIGAADVNTKNQLLVAANKADGRTLATVVGAIVTATKRGLARAEVDAVAADDTLTIDELIALLS